MVVGDLNLNLVIKENIAGLLLNMEGDCEEPQVVKVEVDEIFDVEEGEISDSASVEEISEADFNIKQASPSSSPAPRTANNEVSSGNDCANNNRGRVLTMKDLHKYRITSKTSYSGLHNLAWTQAVNNRPLGDVFVMMEDGSNDNSCSKSSENKVVIDVEDDGEKEEGELEEGEIDLDSESVAGDKDLDLEMKMEVDDQVNERDDLEWRRRVDEIMDELGNLNAADSQSYDALCSRLETTAIKLQKMVLEGDFEEKDILVQLLLVAIQYLYSVFSSLTPILKQQNKAELSRLLAQVTSLKPSLFSSSQLKEVDAIRLTLESSDLHVLPENADNKPTFLQSGNEPGSAASVDQAGQHIPVQISKPGLFNLKSKGLVLPLLDLHKDHDADSLPSPTRELTTTFPFGKESRLDHGMLKPEWPVPRQNLPQQNPVLHPYETDAVKAVSSYQQKFGRGSFFVSDNLLSPTPSDEGDNDGDCEVGGEINSYPAVSSLMPGRPVLPSATMNALPGPEISNVRIDPASNFRSPVLKSSASKSRDPRLRFANFNAEPRKLNQSVPSMGSDESKSKSVDVMSSRKIKIVDELDSDGPAMKRPKNDVSGSDSKTLPLVTAISTSQVSIPIPSLPIHNYANSPLTSQNENLLVKSSSASSPLHSLLRDIAGNPSIWMNILKMEHQKSTGNNNSATQMLNANSMEGSAPSTSSFLPPSSMHVQKPSGIVPCQPVSVEEPGKIRMKPRDPRRILHNKAPQKAVTAVSDPPKANASSCSVMMTNMSSQGQDDQVEKVASSSSVKPTDITMQYTNNLRNIADIMSVSQPCIPSSILPQSLPSHPVTGHHAGTETKLLANETVNFRSGSSLTSEASPSLPPRPVNPSAWSDVEHLFDGFDDKQKAAIQRERSRRIEEQNKMFAARKLCLVLDLDHTLLNSAKFIEVDPHHDELLRKKVEQDHEKPQRHLFRFPHMGMWTKLRPGIWNFLEKASKLYELHLYTMGNKYYATEMAKLLDPKGELFSGRVISRGDNGESFDGDDRVPKSKDFEGVLGMESAAIIIDDSVRVWPHNKPNLIVVERYIYFPCSRRQFGLPGPSLLEIDHDERPEDGTLASSLSVIERIHKNFFEHASLMEADVRNILASEQCKILAGCRIVFSRMFPVDEAKPHMHPLWQTAEQFGAVCSTQIDEQVTHVVANSLGTDKVNWALSRGRFVVYPGWYDHDALVFFGFDLNFVTEDIAPAGWKHQLYCTEELTSKILLLNNDEKQHHHLKIMSFN